MNTTKRERDAEEDGFSSQDESSPSQAQQQTPKKQTGASPKSSPKKKKLEDAEVKDEKRSWTKEEDLVILKAVNDFVSTMQLDYPCILPGIQAANGGQERTKTAVRMRWIKVLKPHLLSLTGAGELKDGR